MISTSIWQELAAIALTLLAFSPTVAAFVTGHASRWAIAIANAGFNALGIGWLVGWILYFKLSATPVPESLDEAVSADEPPHEAPDINLGVLTIVGRFGFACCALTAAWLSMNTLGTGIWSLLTVAVGLIVAVSIFVAALDSIAIFGAVMLGGLAVLAAALMLIASTAGGSMNFSGNGGEILALTIGIALFGLSAKLWGNRQQRRPGIRPAD